MPQYFTPTTNTVVRLALLGAVCAVGLLLWGAGEISRSQYETLQGVPREQPVNFSHQHHVGELGLDCRYCHTTVEYSSYANVPSTKICMNCHSQLWAASAELEPVRQSWRSGKSIEWTRVHDLPDYVYFNHSIHVQKGMGCTTCHGPVDRMGLVWAHASLEMRWCLNCHRNPEQYIRPRQEVFSVAYQPPPDQLSLGRQLVQQYHVKKLTDCDTCHR